MESSTLINTHDPIVKAKLRTLREWIKNSAATQVERNKILRAPHTDLDAVGRAMALSQAIAERITCYLILRERVLGRTKSSHNFDLADYRKLGIMREIESLLAQVQVQPSSP